MKPLKLAKATALGAILSVASDPAILHQAEAMAVAKAQATATNAMQKVWEWLVMAGRKRSF